MINSSKGFTYEVTPRTVLWGTNSITNLAKIIEQLSIKRILLVTSKSLRTGDNMAKLVEILGISLVGVLDDTSAHTPEKVAKEGAGLAQELNADCLISFGGGSIVDTAKAISMIVAEGSDLNKLEQYVDKDGNLITPPMPSQKILHISIPTTLSAAECTGITGITDDGSGVKKLYASPDLAPRWIIYDPTVTLTTPDELWFSTALRVLDHAIERSYSLATNPINDALCLHAIKLIFEFLPKNLTTREDINSRLMLMYGAFLSMSGQSVTCLSHAIGHQLGPRYSNKLFDSTAVTQPIVMTFNRPDSLKEQRAMAVAMGIDVSTLNDEESATLAEQKIKELIKQITDAGIPIPTRIRDTGISHTELSIMAKVVWQSPRLKNNPRTVKNVQEIEDLLEMMW